tara:strand:- start:5129 stop:5563 length:435 start_codon:yes stop_codon:yes gene_type:complete
MKEINPNYRRWFCPDWKHGEGTEQIIEWATEGLNFSIEWSDIFVNGKNERRRRPELAHWTLVWKHGFIGFESFKANDGETRVRAREAAALFIYLWCKQVDPGIASRLAELHARHADYTLCSQCGGRGKKETDDCPKCQGTGKDV